MSNEKQIAPRVTKEQIEVLLNRVEVHTTTCQEPTPHVMAIAWLDGKFHLGTAISKAVNPENFNEEMGIKYSTKDVLDIAENKLWELEGYRLFANGKIDKLLETRIPILDQIYDLCLSIEKCGASPELTDAVTKAGALREPISELVNQAIALGISDGIVSVSYSNQN